MGIFVPVSKLFHVLGLPEFFLPRDSKESPTSYSVRFLMISLPFQLDLKPVGRLLVQVRLFTEQEGECLHY